MAPHGNSASCMLIAALPIATVFLILCISPCMSLFCPPRPAMHSSPLAPPRCRRVLPLPCYMYLPRYAAHPPRLHRPDGPAGTQRYSCPGDGACRHPLSTLPLLSPRSRPAKVLSQVRRQHRSPLFPARRRRCLGSSTETISLPSLSLLPFASFLEASANGWMLPPPAPDRSSPSSLCSPCTLTGTLVSRVAITVVTATTSCHRDTGQQVIARYCRGGYTHNWPALRCPSKTIPTLIRE